MRESDLDAALAALERERSATAAADARRSSATHTNRRAGLALALIALLVAGVLQVTGPDSVIRDPNTDSRAAKVFSSAQSGTCLSWPPGEPDKPSFVQCSSDHLFEVASSVDMAGFAEPCQRTVSAYLGPRYDPNSRFTSSVLWAGDASAAPADRTLLCGLQLLGIDARPMPFRGLVAELDQSRVWPPGTCLGVDAASRPVDQIVDCAGPHAAEVAGSVDLASRITGGPPSESDQDEILRAECLRLADDYLAPRGLQGAGLSSEFTALTRASWAAGSRQVSCTVTPPAGPNWKPLVGRAGREQSDVAPPAAVPTPVSVPVVPPAPPVPVAVPTVTPAPVAPVPATSSPAVPSPTTPPPSTPPPAAPPPTTPSSASPSPEPALGPPPGPAAGETAEAEVPPPNVIQIPGLPPITLPAPPP